MTQIDPDNVFDALKQSLGRMAKAEGGDSSISLDQNLLDLVDADEFADLIEELETSLDVALPLDQVDVASIAHIDRLIAFICRHG